MAGLHDKEGTCFRLGQALGRCSPSERKTEKFPFLTPLSRSAKAPAPVTFLLSSISLLGDAALRRDLCELLCPATIKTDSEFPESVLIQNEISKSEALDEHLKKINVSSPP